MRAQRSTLAMIVTAALGAGGCGGDQDGEGTPIDAAAVPGTVVFRLSYDSDVPDSIFVQSGTELGGQGWLTVRRAAGGDLRILGDCGRCDCDACDPCAVCGAGLPEVTEIPRGGHLDWSWDTRAYADATCPTTGGACEAAAVVAPGAYVATFCWSFTSDGVGAGHHIGPVTCSDEPFELPAAPPGPPTVVEHAFCACG